uniref:Uncharacterized protein n=1 Tax=Arundo donax TaxID=35708 RepID=A0A0A9G977_ARUDO
MRRGKMVNAVTRGALLPSCYTNRSILQIQKVSLQLKNSEYKPNHWLVMQMQRQYQIPLPHPAHLFKFLILNLIQRNSRLQ